MSIEKVVFRVTGDGKTAVVRRSFSKNPSKQELSACFEEVLAQFGFVPATKAKKKA